MCTHGPKGGSKGLDVYPRPQGRIQGPLCVPTAPREDPSALMCTYGPKGGSKGPHVYPKSGSKGLDMYPQPRGKIQGP